MRNYLTLLDLYPEKSATLETFTKELLSFSSHRCRLETRCLFPLCLCRRPLPEPYNHQEALQHVPSPDRSHGSPVSNRETKAPMPSQAPSKSKKKTHVVEQGDNLWKIARKYHVSVEELMRTNRMDSEKLRPGEQIEIPEKSEKR